MNPKYISYAKRLSEVGDQISIISEKFSSVTNNKNLEKKYNDYLIIISEYKECKLSLSSITPPEKVKKEHNQMIDAVQMFISGTESMFKSIDINKQLLDEDLLMNGLLQQKQGECIVVKIADEIVNKLLE